MVVVCYSNFAQQHCVLRSIWQQRNLQTGLKPALIVARLGSRNSGNEGSSLCAAGNSYGWLGRRPGASQWLEQDWPLRAGAPDHNMRFDAPYLRAGT